MVLDGAELFGVPLHERDLLRVKYDTRIASACPQPRGLSPPGGDDGGWALTGQGAGGRRKRLVRGNVVGGQADHLVEMAVKACCEMLEGVAGRGEAVVRLLGRWLVWLGEA